MCQFLKKIIKNSIIMSIIMSLTPKIIFEENWRGLSWITTLTQFFDKILNLLKWGLIWNKLFEVILYLSSNGVGRGFAGAWL